MSQVEVLVVSFKIWGCFSTPQHLLVYSLDYAVQKGAVLHGGEAGVFCTCMTIVRT